MTEKKDDQGLSFKEQILRDLENIKKEEKLDANPDLFGASVGLEPLEKKKNLIDEEALFGVRKTEKAQPAVEPVSPQVDESPVEPVPAAKEEPEVNYPTVEEMMALQKQLEAEAAAQKQAEQAKTAVPEEHKAAIAVNYAQTSSAADDYVDSPVARNPAVKVPHSEVLDKAAEKKAAKAKAQVSQSEELTRSTRKAKKKRRNRTAGRIVAIVLVFFVLVLGVTGFVGYNYINTALQPMDRNSKEFVTVEIPAGSGSRAIGNVLERAGLIRNATVFNFYTQLKNYSGFQSGYYNLQKSMSVDDLAKALQEGGTETPQAPALAKVTIPEGYTIRQIADATANATKDLDAKISAEDFINKVQDEAFIAQMLTKYPRLLGSLPTVEAGVKFRLEGYLFPATYNITADTTVESLIDEMLAAMDTNLSGFYDQIATQGRSVNDILGLASLVEKEGATDADRKDIASVFYNRLAQGMPLQSNIAILYAQDKLGERTTLQEDASIDTNIASPFNIYQNAGLLPGPVDSPSLSAITAVINPTETDYLYFVADVKTGKVYFANNFAEHDQNVQTYVNNQIAASSSEQQ